LNIWRIGKEVLRQFKEFGLVALLFIGGLGLVVPGSSGPALASAADSNPIVIENQQPGTSAWQISRVGSDAVGQIKGYASATSVNKGQNITFYVSVNPEQPYTIDVYRMGWYQGLGGRLMEHIGPIPGVLQPTCPIDATTGMIECNWSPASTLATLTSWTSGIYLALLTNTQGFQNYIVFAVRDDNRVAALMYQQPVTTYQAYNDYPNDNATGKSLYDYNSYGAKTVTGTPRAAKVSFDRPYQDDGSGGSGQSFLHWEINFVRWMERSGYDVTYSTGIDTHTDGGRTLNYRGSLSVGHDEYWSKPMYDAVQSARDAGVNLGFFGANLVFSQVRLEASSSGQPNRVLVCYKDASIDPVTAPNLKTVEWRDSQGPNRPEQALIGIQYVNWFQQNVPCWSYVVANSGNWVYAGTGFANGDSVPGIVGYEADRSFNEYPQPNAVSGSYALLSNSPFTADDGSHEYANSSVYQALSGAWVFAAGTIEWSWALDNYGGRNLADARIQITTANVLNRFVGNPPPDFTLGASPASQTLTQGGSTSYTVTITPSNGFSSVTLSVSGLPSGASASFTPNPAGSTSTLTVTTGASTPAGSYSLTLSGRSGSLTNTAGVTLVVSVPPDFTLNASPASQTVTQGSSTSYTVTITPGNGFTSLVTLSVSGLPVGANASFTPNPASGSSTFTVTISLSTKPGNNALTITGIGGGRTHTKLVNLLVKKK